MLGMIPLGRKDLAFRRWRKPEAELRALAAIKRANAEYSLRRDHLANFIVTVIEQKHVNGHLFAPSVLTLLLALKEEVDRAGGFTIRQPHSDGSSTEGERAQFMSDAFELARTRGDIAIYSDNDQPFLWLYAKHRAPRWIVYRDGRILPEYIPTQEELDIYDQEIDIPSALLVTDHYRSKLRGWGESTELSA
jgi:hypothetical protein